MLHVDLWCSGDFTDYTGSHYLLKIMCDLTQFLVVVPVPRCTSTIIAKHFVQDALFKFGLCYFLVIDDETPFKAEFTAACDSLKVPFECTAKRNHKSLLVENNHRFLNKVVTIASRDRNTLDCFVEVGLSAGYTWNSAPTDGTEIIRSIPAIGRELRFPLDISLTALPKLTDNQANSVVEYLRLTDKDRIFSTEILKILIENKRTTNRDRINNQRNVVTLLRGDVIMARREVMSERSKNKVGKLTYQVSGPFLITRATGHGSYYARKLKDKNSTEQKFMAEGLYPLPPSLLPCDPIDGADVRYINHSHPSITHPFEKYLNITSYHEKHFSSPPLLAPPKFDYNHKSLKFVNPSSPILYPSIIELHRETHTVPPSPVSTCNSVYKPLPYTPRELSNLINPTCNIFFFHYIPEDSIRLRWFLVRIELELTHSLNLKLVTLVTTRRPMMMLAGGPSVMNIPSALIIFMTLANEYCSILYVNHLWISITFWTKTIPLSDSNCYLSGPFHFEVRHDVLNQCNYIARDQWLLLHSLCSLSSIIFPILSPTAITPINPSVKTPVQTHTTLLPDKQPKKRKSASTSVAPPLRRSSRHQS